MNGFMTGAASDENGAPREKRGPHKLSLQRTGG